jgi:hypothetical protein
MPEFSDYVEVEAEIEVSVDDFISACSKSEIGEIITALEEDGYIKPNSSIGSTCEKNILDHEWEEVCSKLYSSRLVLTTEEEEIIKKIASRL